ncbi:unnamed protein product [Rotaria sp. Silwood1]|nr:unnamed protein product [Rotaria sp. Silwood1]CAF1676639.1 unnamed protein product [Rotaria sp. Silwood1]
MIYLNVLIKKEDFLNEFNYLETIRDINRQYDEIVLTNCIIDERFFLENKFQLNDLSNQHITSNDYQTISFNQYLTFISQANQLIKLLYSIVQQQQTKPTNNLISIIGQQTFFIKSNIK